MADITQVSFCVLFIICFIDLGQQSEIKFARGLTCLKCNSSDVMGYCRTGARKGNMSKVQTCFGVNAGCYATAIVSDYGEALFERGCSRLGVCKDDDKDLEFCYVCRHKNCNFVPMELDPDVENYLLGKTNGEIDGVEDVVDIKITEGDAENTAFNSPAK